MLDSLDSKLALVITEGQRGQNQDGIGTREGGGGNLVGGGVVGDSLGPCSKNQGFW